MKKAQPPAAALKPRRATRARRLRGLSLTVVGLLALGCGSARPRQPARSCQETVRQGVFHEASLACIPELASALEDWLCAATFTRGQGELNRLGFGYGTSVLGHTLQERYGLDPVRVQRWKRQHCAGSPARSEQEVAELRDRAFSLLPASLVGPWQSCWNFFDRGCIVLGSFDLTGEGESVEFLAVYGSTDFQHLGVRLKEDLEVRGADCGGKLWRAGSWVWIWGDGRRLTCKRQGRSAVSFRLVTGVGLCEARLPELKEPPWQELCATP